MNNYNAHATRHARHSSQGLAAKWLKQGFEYVVFFQDTNGLGFVTLGATLGVSKEVSIASRELTAREFAFYCIKKCRMYRDLLSSHAFAARRFVPCSHFLSTNNFASHGFIHSSTS